MNKDMRKDTEFEIKSLKYLIKRLGVLERDITKTVEKEKAARKAQVDKLSEYKTVQEAQDAFGYELITEDEYHEICDVLEKGAEFVEFTKTPKSAALKELRSYISSLQRDLENNEWELKAPEEQERILKENAEFRAKHNLN